MFTPYLGKGRCKVDNHFSQSHRMSTKFRIQWRTPQDRPRAAARSFSLCRLTNCGVAHCFVKMYLTPDPGSVGYSSQSVVALTTE